MICEADRHLGGCRRNAGSAIQVREVVLDEERKGILGVDVEAVLDLLIHPTSQLYVVGCLEKPQFRSSRRGRGGRVGGAGCDAAKGLQRNPWRGRARRGEAGNGEQGNVNVRTRSRSRRRIRRRGCCWVAARAGQGVAGRAAGRNGQRRAMLGGRGFDHGFRLPEVSFDGFAETGDLLPSTSSNNNSNNNKQANVAQMGWTVTFASRL